MTRKSLVLQSTYWGDKMGNWNRHFVRVGSDGNMGVYDQKGNRFIRENLGSDGLPARIAIIPNSKDNNATSIPTEISAFEFESQNEGFSRLNPNKAMVINPSATSAGSFQYDFNQEVDMFQLGSLYGFKQIPSALNGFLFMSGSPDLRTGVTAADASAITIFSSTASGTRYEVKARILATSGSSATYTISWTEGGVAQTVALTITAVDTEVHDNFVIAPDADTNITAQITALTSSTVNVDAIVSVLG